MAMVESEREMVLRLTKDDQPQERFTSLQPTYEDSVPPSDEDDWFLNEREAS